MSKKGLLAGQGQHIGDHAIVPRPADPGHLPILSALAPATLDAGNGWSVWLNVAYGAVFAAAGAPATLEYNQPAWCYLVLAGVSVLAVTFGGWLYIRRKQPPYSQKSLVS